MVAWTITAALYLATIYDLTRFIDSRFLILVEDLSRQGFHAESADKSPGAEKLPVLLALGPGDYRDRSRLAQEIGTLVALRPKAIVVDIDVSPDRFLRGDGQTALDRVLDGALAQGTQLLFITPLDREDKDDISWMVERCKHGVAFALPELFTDFGAAIRFAHTYPSLGVVAQTFSGEDSPRSQLTLRELCDSVPNSNPDFVWKSRLQDAADGETSGIDFRESLEFLDYEEAVNSTRLAARIKDGLVFVGSNSDPRDRHATAVGELYGVQVHAAIARTKIENNPHWSAYLLEICIGVLTGTSLALLWNRYDHARSRYRSVLESKHAGVGAVAAAFVRTPMWALAIAGVCGTAVAVTVWLSVDLFRSGAWLNPAPLVVGMLVDTALARHGHTAPIASATAPLPAWKKMVDKTLGNLVPFALIAASLYHLTMD